MNVTVSGISTHKDEALSLAHAASIVEEVAFALAGDLDKEKVADLILISAKLEKQARELSNLWGGTKTL